MKGFAIHNSMTDHGGIIPATQMKASQMGNLFLLAGDGHYCPKCKCWSTIIKSHDHVIFFGKSVAYAGDKLTCGARVLPKQSHVVGDSGKPYFGNSATSSQNQQESFRSDVIKKNFIDLLEVQVAPFIPLGIPTADGTPRSPKLKFYGEVINGIFEAITLEIKKDGAYTEVARLNQSFLGSKKFKIEWDGFIKDLYDSKFMTNPNGISIRVKGINGGHAIAQSEKVFKFKYALKDWMDVLINKKSHRILINLRANFVEGWVTIGLLNGHAVSKKALQQFGKQPYSQRTKTHEQLEKLAMDGINYYWSRNSSHPTGKNITIQGNKYEVFVKTIPSKINALPKMVLTYVTNLDPNDSLLRSSNWELSRKTAYMTGYLQLNSEWVFYSSSYSDKKFKETIAHETGHAIVEAYAGFHESITHHGSSGIDQNPKTGTKYPSTGEIDLMKYADDELTDYQNWENRIIANEKDVSGLLIISSIVGRLK